MARAIIRGTEEADGGLEVIVPTWTEVLDDSVKGQRICLITAETMGEILDEMTEDGASEPDYLELTYAVCDIVSGALSLSWGSDTALRKAVYEAVSPGPGIDALTEFDV